VSSTSLLARGALAAAMLVLVAGCGDDEGDSAEDPSGDTPSSLSPSATDGGTGLPACDEVWVAGATLPRSYQGCEQDGTAVQADKHACSYGGAIVEFDDRFYAVAGKQINEVRSLAGSDQFRQALSACQG
jgi:hypothetical protein